MITKSLSFGIGWKHIGFCTLVLALIKTFSDANISWLMVFAPLLLFVSVLVIAYAAIGWAVTKSLAKGKVVGKK